MVERGLQRQRQKSEVRMPLGAGVTQLLMPESGARGEGGTRYELRFSQYGGRW